MFLKINKLLKRKILISKWRFGTFNVGLVLFFLLAGGYFFLGEGISKIFASGVGIVSSNPGSGDISVDFSKGTFNLTKTRDNNGKTEVGLDNGYQGEVANSTGLVSYWKMDEGTGTKMADETGRNDFVLRVPEAGIDGKMDKAVGLSFFNIGGEYRRRMFMRSATSDDFNFGTGDFTISTWVKPNTMNNVQRLVSAGTGSGEGKLWSLGFGNGWGNGNVIGFTIFDIDLWRQYNVYYQDYFSNPIPDLTEDWHQIVMTRAGGDITFYLDGEQIGISNIDSSWNVNSDDFGLSLGARYDNNFEAKTDEYYYGKMDETRIYKGVALSETQVVDDYNNGNGTVGSKNEDGLVAGWHFDENLEETIGKDFSDNGHDLTYGGPYFWDENGRVKNGLSFYNSEYGFNEVSTNGIPRGTNPTISIEAYIKSKYSLEGDGLGTIFSVTKNFENNCDGSQLENRTIAFLVQSDGQLGAYHWGEYDWSNTGVYINEDQWYHVVYVNDGPEEKIYVNGELAASRENTGFTITDDAISAIGMWNDSCGSRYKFYGTIDELAVYDSALSDQDVANHFAARTDGFGSDGSWESEAVDTVWNGGWANDVALSAKVSGVTENEKIKISLRSADSADGLNDATYEDIGGWITSDGTTEFSAQDLASVEAKRFVQIKAAFSQPQGLDTTPYLEEIKLFYDEDTVGPETDLSGIEMKRNAGEDAIESATWTNSKAPYFSWNNAVDSESGVKGYCLYLGQQANGNPVGSAGILVNRPSTYGTLTVDPSEIENAGCDFVIIAQNVSGDSQNPGITSFDFGSADFGTNSLATSNNSYYLAVKAIDLNNNVSQNAQVFEFKFDNTLPRNVSYISLPSNFIPTPVDSRMIWSTQDGNSATDLNSGLLGLQYRIGQNGEWKGTDENTTNNLGSFLQSASGSYVFTEQDFPVVQNGVEFIYVRSIDNAGNASNIVSGVLKINKDAPATPKDLSVNPTDNSSKNEYTFSWNAPDPIGDQNVANFAYCYTINTTPNAQNCMFTAKGVTSMGPAAFASRPGENIFYLVAKDTETGSINYETYAQISFNYSGESPSNPRNLDVSDISIKATSNWKLALSWDEPAYLGAGVSSYRVFRSNKNTDCVSSPVDFSEIGSTMGTSYVDTGLAQKTYYYCVSACDSANNCGLQSATVSKLPTGKFTEPADLVGGPETSKITTKRAEISWTTDRGSDSKIALGEKSNEYDKEEISNSNQTTEHVVELSKLNPGTDYYYRAKWTDEDGNTGQSEEKSFKTDPAPTVKDAKAQDLGISDVTIHFTTKGASKAKVYFGTSTSFGGSKEISTGNSSSSYDVKLDNLSDDTKYYYKINTFDSEGSEYEGTTLDFTTLPRPKISNVHIEEVKGTAQPTINITWDTNVETTSMVFYQPTNNETQKKENIKADYINGTHKATITNLFADTPYQLTIKGRDHFGNEATSDDYKFNTSTDTRPPAISDLNVEGVISASRNQNNSTETAQLVVSWNTDEAATSQVEFGEGTGTSYEQRTQEDANLTTNHLVVISGLTPSKVYHLRAISKDKANNSQTSIDTVMIAPKKTDSALNLVLSSLGEIFGFIANK